MGKINYLMALMLFSLSAGAVTPSIYVFSPGLRIGDEFNLGHVLRVGGYIGSGENIELRAEFYIDPGANQVKITEFEHSFSTGESLLLSEYEDELTFRIQDLAPGTHYVKMFLYDTSLPENSSPIADTQSVFYATDKLDLSSCGVDKSIVLIGEDITVFCPYILSSFGATGSYANISLGDYSIQISAPEGSFSQTIPYTSHASGDKTVFLEVWDSFGNNANKTTGFIVSNKIIIRANADTYFVPGQDIPLLVYLENVRGDPVVGDINATMFIDSTRVERSQRSTASATFRFPIPTTTPPGTYHIKLDASDGYGNKAESEFFTFNVTRVAMSLDTSVDGSTFGVGNVIGYGVTVYDQQNQTIQGKPILVEIYSGTSLFQSLNLTTDSEGKAEGQLQVTSSMPAGIWELRYMVDDAIATEHFTVEPLYDLILVLDTPSKSGDKITFPLTISNNGNRDITSELTITCEECLGMRTRTVSVTQGHVRHENVTWYYSLSQPPGEYNISFCLNVSAQDYCSNVQTFEIGQTMSHDTGFYFLLLAGAFVGLLVLLYLAYYMRHSRTSHL